MITSVPQFIATLRDGQLLEPAQLDELARGPLGKVADPRVLAKELVQRSWLTPFQVNLLLQGRAAELVFGPFRLQDRLGEGRTGKVFKAFHVQGKNVLALKILHREKLPDPPSVARLYQDIQAVQKQGHPNVVLVAGVAMMGDVHVVMMEYVQGSDLGKLLKQGQVGVEQACDWVHQAALGLQFFHERGLVHRDIKPNGLLLTQGKGPQPPGVVKLLDLGQARLQVPAAEYAAPEVGREPNSNDIRADLYSLGCTFYSLLTGQLPFRGASVTEVRQKHLTAQAAPVQGVRPAVTPA